MSSNEEINSQDRHQSGGLGGLILIFIGVVFLLNNFGVLSWEIWNTLWRFWPVILILGGLEILFGKSKLASLIVAIIAIAAITYFLLYFTTNNYLDFNQFNNFLLPLLQR